jgi:hypothetical protein
LTSDVEPRRNYHGDIRGAVDLNNDLNRLNNVAGLRARWHVISRGTSVRDGIKYRWTSIDSAANANLPEEKTGCHILAA